ncbi:MAG TPA: hypothetical protein VD926_10340 [Acidimicrobiales bacterium]|nr:hypothetical protein [Acidimicrobiales bacterium]
MLRPSIYSLTPPAPWRRLLCRLAGCRWEERVGYDFCVRCHSAEWHLARRLAVDGAA